MPDSVKFRNRRVSILTALVVMGFVLGGLELVIGYGNAVQSCQRTRDTRVNGNTRVEHASTFWRESVAGRRERASANARQLAGELRQIPGRLAAALADYYARGASSDAQAAAEFRAYAAQLLVDRADVPDCSQFPPPAK